ncbi:class I SAM-dependent methyltransferase [Nostoc sp. LPT]|uniref:class I SAM-dependent methyltransferase n=1 Tax=Nostoc sp. LPT TaxID=2815387 RepID=UPI0025CDD06A|nr:class I SAM-dependent methyltransferase [Nostoc sp. LPT]
MEQTGPNFYDDEAVFTTYIRHRQRIDRPNDTLEKPMMMDLIRPITGKRILDLGCGDAAVGRELLDRGAASYTGIEGSHKLRICVKRVRNANTFKTCKPMSDENVFLCF